MIHTNVEAVRRLLDERGRRIVIALDGSSGAGKSTIAAALVDRVPATVIPTDDFFAADVTTSGWDPRTAAERARDAIVRRRMRRSALEPLLAGQPATWHAIGFVAGMRADGTYAMASESVRRDSAPVIILDGTYSSRPELADVIDLAVCKSRFSDRVAPRTLQLTGHLLIAPSFARRFYLTRLQLDLGVGRTDSPSWD